MDDFEFKIAPVRFRDLIAVSKITHENMVGADREFTRLVDNPAGRLLSNLLLPVSLYFAGSGYRALRSNALAGCAFFTLRDQSGYVFNVLVDRRFRRHGAGTLLMNHLETVVRERSRNWLTLQVDHDNVPARRMYESLGYWAYHPEFYRGRRGALDLSDASGTITLNYQRATVGRRMYDQYLRLECEKGDPWALGAIDDLGQTIDADGEFYSCIVNDTVAGCAQRIFKHDRLRVELLLDPAQWGNWFTLRATNQLFEEIPSQISTIEVNLGSSQHHQTKRSRLQAMGFSSCVASRHFMAKRIE